LFPPRSRFFPSVRSARLTSRRNSLSPGIPVPTLARSRSPAASVAAPAAPCSSPPRPVVELYPHFKIGVKKILTTKNRAGSLVTFWDGIRQAGQCEGVGTGLWVW